MRQDIDEASRQRHAIAERFEQVEGRLPDSEQTWDAKRAMLAETLDTYEERLKDANARFQQLVGERHDRQRDRDSLRRDYQRKLTHRTRISDDMDDARTLIMRATGLDASELPYVAELMDVNEQNEQWRLAMNVTYAPIAQTILVDKRHEQGFAAKISAIDPKLMTRRTWRFIDTGMQYESSASEGWMSSKLQYREDSPFAGWLKNQTTSPRFDARCVHAIDDMNHDERQVQADGQIKSGDRGFHGSKGLHQVIGFMNEQYLAELKNQLDKAEQALQNADRRSEQMSNAISLLQDEHELARIVADMPWSKIDVNGLREQETRIRRQIERIENDPELGQLQTELKQLNQQATAENRNQYQAEDDLDKPNTPSKPNKHGSTPTATTTSTMPHYPAWYRTYSPTHTRTASAHPYARKTGQNSSQASSTMKAKHHSTRARYATSHASHAHESKKSTPDPTNCAPTRNASWTTTSTTTPQMTTPSWQAWKTTDTSSTNSTNSTCSSPAPQPTKNTPTASKNST